MRIAAAAFAIVLLACEVNDAVQPQVHEATVCEIVRHPEAYIGKTVTIVAPIESDLIHRTLLMGPECGRGITISIPEPVGEGGLWAAIGQPWPGTRGKNISARVTGSLQKNPTEGARPRYFMIVSSINDLKVAVGTRP